MPRIPQGYAKYLARTKSGLRDHLEKTMSDLDPYKYRVDTQVMAPTRASALRYIRQRYSPDAHDEVVSLEELYGPYLPSEERMIHPRGLSSAYMRELERRRQEATDNYYRFTPQEDRLPPEDVAAFADRKARYDLEDYLGTRSTPLPVLQGRMRGHLTPQSRMEYYYSFTPEDVEDRLRFQGIPDEEFGWIEPNPFTARRRR